MKKKLFNRYGGFNHSVVLLLAGLLINGVSARAQAIPDSLSFNQAIEIALANDNNVQASQAIYNGSTNDIAKARADYYPKLSLASSYSHISLVNEMTLSMPAPIGEKKIQVATDNPFSAALNLSGEIYTFGRRPAAVAIARAGHRSDELRYSNVKKSIFDLAARSYMAVVLSNQSLELLKIESERFDQIVKLVENRYDQGLASEYEVLQTKFRQENYRSSVIEMTNSLSAARCNLAKLLNVTSDKLPILTSGFNDRLLAYPSNDALEDAFGRREDYLDACNIANRASQAKKLVRSSLFPNLSLFAAYSWRNGNQPDLGEIRGIYSLGINLNWLLFDGFSRRAELRKNDQLIKAAGLSQDEFRKTIPTQIKNQYLTMQNLASKLEIQVKSLALAQKAMSIARTRFEIGDLTMIELLDAENNLALAELGLLKSKFDYFISQLDLKRAVSFYPELTN